VRTRRSEAGAQAEADLKYWGYSVGKQYAADGYPAENPILNLLCGHSDLNPLAPMFGINVKDIPADAWRINARVMKLRGELRKVLVARYCVPVDYETGRPYTHDVLAEHLGMTARTYGRRLMEARDKFARLVLAERALAEAIADGWERNMAIVAKVN
jgi:hypothetical protein